MSFHVLVPDNVHQKAIDILEASAGISVCAPGKMERAALLEAVADAQALIIRSGVRADAELIDKARELKAIARAGVGVDNVDLSAATAWRSLSNRVRVATEDARDRQRGHRDGRRHRSRSG